MTNRAWIQEKLIELNYDAQSVYNLYTVFKMEQGSQMILSSYKRRVRETIEELELDEIESVELSGEDIIQRLVKTSAQKQRLQDLKTHEVKIKREGERLYNILNENFENIIELLEKTDLSKIILPRIKKDKTKKYGILQLSDHHFNEIILPEETHRLNSFDFEIGSKRLRKFILESIGLFKYYKVTDINICLTGDLINSGRRLSEKLAQSTSLSKAYLLVVFLFEQAFLELRREGFRLHITSVVGNESRIPDHMESNEMTASENWDFLIFNSLRHLFKKVKDVNFIIPDNSISSLVRLPNGFNFLIMHGHTIKGDLEKAVGKIIQNYNHQGISINMVLTGHFHNAHIGDFACRSSSLCGANAYSHSDLMFISRASQNLYIVNSDKGFHGMKIDLQNVDDVEGYNLLGELESYIKPMYNKATVKILAENLC